jgi:hypothetical protein
MQDPPPLPLNDRVGVFRRAEDFAQYAEELRRAGLPE